MIIDTPADAIRFATSKDDLTSDGTPLVMRANRQRSMFLYYYRDSVPDDGAYTQAAEFLRGITEIDITLEDTKGILSLYPEARIKLAEYGMSDTECRDAVAFAAAHFFLGSAWPSDDDNIDLALFVTCLKDEARRMGFIPPTVTT